MATEALEVAPSSPAAAPEETRGITASKINFDVRRIVCTFTLPETRTFTKLLYLILTI